MKVILLTWVLVLGLSGAQNITFSETTFTARVLDIVYVGESEIVFALLANYDVYRSADGGATWRLQTAIRDAVQGVTMDVVFIEHISDLKVFFVAQESRGRPSYQVNFWTEDGGVTYERVGQGLDFKSLNFNKNENRTGYAIGQAEICYIRGCLIALVLSTDYGRTWKELVYDVYSPTWGNAGRYGIPDTTIYTLLYNRDTQYFDLVRIDDFLPEFAVVLSTHVISFLISPEFVFTTKERDDDPTILELYIGSHGGPMLKADTPVEITTQMVLSVGDMSSGVIPFMIWTPTEDGVVTGDLYISDSTGTQFYHSLSNLYQPEADPTLSEYYSMQGLLHPVYFSVVKKLETMQPTSVITYDRGNTWKEIAAPAVDIHGNPTCENCTLHIQTTVVAPLTSPYAPGLIVALGNVGEYLNSSIEALDTYISRDAGLTWSQVAEGPRVGKVGYFGTVLLLADFSTPRTTFSYSLNSSNYEFTEVNFTTNPTTILDIQAVPSQRNKHWLLVGTRLYDGFTALIRVNFDSITDVECQGADAPGTEGSDYELFTPPGVDCQLGTNVSYLRRKPGVTCWDSIPAYSEVQITYCNCTDADYECDYGYNRVDDACVLQKTYDPKAICSPGLQYEVTRGYRLVGGDKCINPTEDLLPIKVDCPILRLGNDSFTVPTGENATLPVLANDQGIGGNKSLTVLSITQPGGDTVITITEDKKSVFIVTPKNGSLGLVTFTYTVIYNDDVNINDTATVYVNIVPAATVAPTAAPTEPPKPTGTTGSSSENITPNNGKTSAGVIAGAVVGVIVGIALIVGLVVFIVKKRTANSTRRRFQDEI